MASGPSDGSSDDEWWSSLEDVSDDGERDGDDPSSDDGSIFGPRPDEGSTELRRGRPDAENALFVALGIATTLLLLAELAGAL